LAERSDIQDLINDKDFLEALNKKLPVLDLLNNPRTLVFLNTPDLAQALLTIDLKDLREYLQSGKSAKYDSFNILGRWDLDPEQVIVQTKKAKPDITSSEMGVLKKMLSTLAAGTYFKAFYDNKFVLVMNGDFGNFEQLKQVAMAASAAEAAKKATNVARANPDAGVNIPADVRRRYGMGAAPPPAAAPDATPQPEAPKIVAKTLQGTWDGEGDSYIIKLQDDKGKNVEMTTRIQADEVTLAFPGQRLVFVKQ